MITGRLSSAGGVAVLVALVAACGSSTVEQQPGPEGGAHAQQKAPPAKNRRVDSRPPPMHQPVPLFEGGRVARQIDAANASMEGYVVFDLGEEWTPYLFTERDSANPEPKPNAYRATYLALARGEFPNDHHGERARRDKYLELYGILPTLGVLRDRMKHVRDLACARELDLEPLKTFEGFIAYRGMDRARRDVQDYAALGRFVREVMREQGVEEVAQIDRARLDTREQRRLDEFIELEPKMLAIRAAQARLSCEGFLPENIRGRRVRGGMDWATQQALAEFERRHRVYGWGYIGHDTLEALRKTPMELEQESVIRVLHERAMHAAGVIEDGSTSTHGDGRPRTFRGADGREHPIPNLEQQIRDNVIAAFGLETPESTLAWLEGLGELPRDQERLVAVRGPELPEYYDGDMELSMVVDRGDVWYEFPYDEQGRERAQPVSRRPRLTVFTTYNGQRIPLAKFGTTIGGWRSESVEGAVMWKYKNSPTGERVWHQIVASPVWLPPESTPARELLTRRPGRTGADAYYVNLHETGPSYASAYGLVAAYHMKFRNLADGSIALGGDEGIRTHGSVDYMSIMRRHSHGCHRLHNHIAVRLMSFVLAHRPHRRQGQQRLSFRLPLEHDGHEYLLELEQGGYVFSLERPIPVNVLEGRIRGNRQTPIEHPIPKFNQEIGAYILPDGGAVAVDRSGSMRAIPMPQPDGGVLGAPDGGYYYARPDGAVSPVGLTATTPPPASQILLRP